MSPLACRSPLSKTLTCDRNSCSNCRLDCKSDFKRFMSASSLRHTSNLFQRQIMLKKLIGNLLEEYKDDIGFDI